MASRLSTSVTGLLACLLLSACPGSLDPDDFPNDPIPPCRGDVDVPREIFAMRCGTSSCHEGDEPAAELDLLGPDPLSELVGVPSTQCDGRLRVDPADVRSSFLLDKLRGPSVIPPGCGDPMPFLSRLNGNEIGCVERWIRLGLTGDVDGGPGGVDSGPGTDAGPGVDTGPGDDAGPMDAGTDTGPMGVDCSGVNDLEGLELCREAPDRCELVFRNGPRTCADACAAAGLTCMEAFDDLSPMCEPDLAAMLSCDMDMGMAYYCICGMPE